MSPAEHSSVPASKRFPWILIEDALTKKNVDEKLAGAFVVVKLHFCQLICRPAKRRRVEDSYNQAVLQFQTGEDHVTEGMYSNHQSCVGHVT